MKKILGIALEVPDPVPNIENRYECTGKRKRCKINYDNSQSKSEKDNIPMPKKQGQSYKSICRAYSSLT